MSTPHNSAEKGDIAQTVLMPGDPLRAKWIAETYLENAELVSDVRNVYCYTGIYKGKQLSVMASGMGMPSMGIYSYELYKFYDVENIIRIGSAGAYTKKLNLMDVVLADAAWSESAYGYAQCLEDSEWKYPSKELNTVILSTAEKNGKSLQTGPIHSSDVFYYEAGIDSGALANQCAVVEMESFALFHNAKVLGKNAACLLTISDSFVTKEETTAEERQTSFTSMIKIALEAACHE